MLKEFNFKGFFSCEYQMTTLKLAHKLYLAKLKVLRFFRNTKGFKSLLKAELIGNLVFEMQETTDEKALFFTLNRGFKTPLYSKKSLPKLLKII